MLYIIFMKNRYKLKVHLRRLRFERNQLTQQELAEMVGVSRQTIISIEKGKYKPSVELALLLAKALDVKVEDIFSIESGGDK